MLCLIVLIALALWPGGASAGEAAEDASPTYEGDAEAGRALERQGMAAYQERRYVEAAGLYQRAWDAYQHPRYQYNVGQCNRAAERWEPALAAYRRRLQLQPAPYNFIHTHIGQCLLGLNRREEANQALRRYLELEPNGHYAGQARRALETGQWPTDEEQRDPETVRGAQAVYDRADALVERERFREAAEVSLQGYEQYPRVHELLYNAAICYLDGQLWAEAGRTFQRFLQTPGADHDAWVFLAEAQYEQFQFNDAVQSYERYLELEPTGTYADQARDFILAIIPPSGGTTRGRPPTQEAIENFEQAFTEGQRLFDEGEYERARRAFELAAMAVPTDRNVNFNIGRCDEELNNWRGARVSYETFLQAGDQGSAAVVHLFLARVFLRLNQRGEASRHIRAYVDRARAEELPNEVADVDWASELLQECRGSGGSSRSPSPDDQPVLAAARTRS